MLFISKCYLANHGAKDELKGATPIVPVECGQSDGAIGALFRKDRVPQSGPDTGHVVTRRWVLVSGQKWQSAGKRRSSTGR